MRLASADPDPAGRPLTASRSNPKSVTSTAARCAASPATPVRPGEESTVIHGIMVRSRGRTFCNDGAQRGVLFVDRRHALKDRRPRPRQGCRRGLVAAQPQRHLQPCKRGQHERAADGSLTLSAAPSRRRQPAQLAK